MKKMRKDIISMVSRSSLSAVVVEEAFSDSFCIFYFFVVQLSE